MTSYKAVAERFPALARYAGYALLFFALFLAGMWHGSKFGFAVFGILQGLGAAMTQIYGDLLRWRLKRPGFNRYMKNRWIEVAAVFVTLHYFCFSMLFFSSGVRNARQLLEAGLRGVPPAIATPEFWLRPGWEAIAFVGVAIGAGASCSTRTRWARRGPGLPPGCRLRRGESMLPFLEGWPWSGFSAYCSGRFKIKRPPSSTEGSRKWVNHSPARPGA